MNRLQITTLYTPSLSSPELRGIVNRLQIIPLTPRRQRQSRSWRCEWVTNYYQQHRGSSDNGQPRVVNGLQITITDTRLAVGILGCPVVNGLQITITYTPGFPVDHQPVVVNGSQITITYTRHTVLATDPIVVNGSQIKTINAYLRGMVSALTVVNGSQITITYTFGGCLPPADGL